MGSDERDDDDHYRGPASCTCHGHGDDDDHGDDHDGDHHGSGSGSGSGSGCADDDDRDGVPNAVDCTHHHEPAARLRDLAELSELCWRLGAGRVVEPEPPPR